MGLVVLIALMLVVVPAAAVTIGELPPADRADAWQAFRVATLGGLVASILGTAWQWWDASRRGWVPAASTDPKTLKYVVGACGGAGLLLSELAAGMHGVVLFGFSAGFFPIFFTGLYVIEKRRRATASQPAQRTKRRGIIDESDPGPIA